MRRPLLILLLVVAIAPTSAMASEWYRCRSTGAAMTTCCCPAAADDRRGPADEPEASAACCCDLEQARTTASDPRLRVDSTSTEVTAPAQPVSVILPPAPTTVPVVVLVSRPALPRGPPVFLRNRTLLI